MTWTAKNVWEDRELTVKYAATSGFFTLLFMILTMVKLE
tara:strand:+ start:775 stop:891 length:117 start_codon:yes stop_codon:yes gene_type:complete